ncbi:hypothetical protein HYY72_00115 [Candidatus Woesearchaeota archaeon]|nr:hypothetical protein [Candidatus Woesearchaeota archaeon]
MKAQISGQVFIYIFSMIVASAVLIFGYVAITNLNKVNTELQMTRFTEKLREDFDSAKGFGTVRNEQSYKEIPQQIQNVCFAYIEKIYEPRSSMAARLSQIEDIQIRNSIESDQTAFSQNPPDTSSIKNVFLIKMLPSNKREAATKDDRLREQGHSLKSDRAAGHKTQRRGMQFQQRMPKRIILRQHMQASLLLIK